MVPFIEGEKRESVTPDRISPTKLIHGNAVRKSTGGEEKGKTSSVQPNLGRKERRVSSGLRESADA